jgi:hypothetical protein
VHMHIECLCTLFQPSHLCQPAALPASSVLVASSIASQTATPRLPLPYTLRPRLPMPGAGLSWAHSRRQCPLACCAAPPPRGAAGGRAAHPPTCIPRTA